MAVAHMARRNAERQAGWHYARKFRWSTHCVYCGMPATTLDHVFPLSIAAQLDLRRPGVRATLGQGLSLVPACRECNGIAGRHPFTSIRAKRAFIQERLRKRLARHLHCPDWEDDEVKSLGYSLRCEVIKGLRARQVAAMRCNWPQVRPR